MSPKSSEPAWVVVVASARDARGRRGVLLVRHPRRAWELPGGRIEADETPVAAARREFREETGHALARARVLGAYPRSRGAGVVVTGRRGRPAPLGRAFRCAVATRWPPGRPLSFPDDPYEPVLRRAGFDGRRGVSRGGR